MENYTFAFGYKIFVIFTSYVEDNRFYVEKKQQNYISRFNQGTLSLCIYFRQKMLGISGSWVEELGCQNSWIYH